MNIQNNMSVIVEARGNGTKQKSHSTSVHTQHIFAVAPAREADRVERRVNADGRSVLKPALNPVEAVPDYSRASQLQRNRFHKRGENEVDAVIAAAAHEARSEPLTTEPRSRQPRFVEDIRRAREYLHRRGVATVDELMAIWSNALQRHLKVRFGLVTLDSLRADMPSCTDAQKLLDTCDVVSVLSPTGHEQVLVARERPLTLEQVAACVPVELLSIAVPKATDASDPTFGTTLCDVDQALECLAETPDASVVVGDNQCAVAAKLAAGLVQRGRAEVGGWRVAIRESSVPALVL